MAGLFSTLFSRKNATPDTGKAVASPLPDLLLQAERISRALNTGTHGRRMAGAGESFWQYRPSQPGEPAYAIDWRQSARSDQLWVREREHQTPQSLVIWCDPSPSMQWRSKTALPFKRERAQAAALGMARALLRGGERVGIAGNSATGVRFRSGQAAFEALAHDLLSASPTDWPDAALLPSHAHMLLISDFLWEETRLDTLLAAIGSRPGRAHLFCVRDPGEMALQDAGRVRFLPVEAQDGESLTLSAVENLASDYAAVVIRHLEAIRTACTARRADFALHVTDQSPMPALLALHARLGGLA